MVEEELQFYKVNVGYSVVVRLFEGDKDGVLLSPRGRDSIGIAADKIRDFKNANKAAIIEGKIVPIEEPSMDWETANALTDADVADLLKNYLKLKSAIPTIDSLPILYKLIEEAKSRDLSKRTLSLIQARIDELEPEEAPIFRKDDMQGSRDG